MQEAGVVNLFRTIAIIIIVYYTFRIVFRYVIPYLLGLWIKRKQKEFERQQGDASSQSTTKKKNKGTDKLGDYVDYEEVD